MISTNMHMRVGGAACDKGQRAIPSLHLPVHMLTRNRILRFPISGNIHTNGHCYAPSSPGSAYQQPPSTRAAHTQTH